MPIGSFSEFVSGFTSDHTYQTANAVSYANDGSAISVSGMTWNLFNKGHDKSADRAYSNNPFNVEETNHFYALRKRNQLRFLWHQIKSKTIDFMVLQEVDIFTQDPLPDFVKEFLEQLRKSGWYTVHTDKSDNVRMPLITLYNTAKLSLIDKRAFLPGHNSKNTCLEATFKYTNTNSEICITNMHLDYEMDHRLAIIEYQQKQIAENKLTIIGGDANHPPNKEYYSLIGDLNLPTNISLPHGNEQPSDEGGLYLQRFDGFMISPANKQSRVEITEGPGAYFKWIPANVLIKTIQRKKEENTPLGKYAARTFDPKRERLAHMTHISLPGMPWIRDKYKHLLMQSS